MKHKLTPAFVARPLLPMLHRDRIINLGLMLQAFRNEEYLWWQVAEYGYSTFMIRSRSRA
jgi:hypothetical protein